ncbi:MAG TPA: LLM class flavin-dependent oxidoreductase [Frankiaceae bacterium]|jgi:alkanesulfonate monooxygenase SsuD/methylene tetrahydromethanopterin reductase-like flavin-dependent oxidoreductase (luciferase family)|nr:LLM class flavin-dependent oxidoreductase [Frankiaceae bacterium]
MTLRTGVVILPDLRWQQSRERWREAEQRGFHTAWTYDHLSWRTLRDGPWLGAVPLLAAAAETTTTMRLGTLVTTPNYRHPALLAKDVMTLDEISGGRFDLGIGAGGTSWDATALGARAPTLPERATRFEDFTAALDVMLREPSGTYTGKVFSAPEYRTLPGCTQRPRVPFTIAALGPRALAVAAEHGSCWVTYGPVEDVGGDEWYAVAEAQAARLDESCRARGREPSDIRRMVLLSLEAEWADGTKARWDDFTARTTALGFTDVVVHWPRPDDRTLPGCAPDVFEAITAAL